MPRSFLCTTALAAAVTLTLVGAAAAADLPTAAYIAPNAAELYAASLSTDWSGFYLGAVAGYGWGEEDPVDLQAFPDSTAVEFGTLAPEGWLGGVTAGYNVQAGNIVFGVETDLQASDFAASGETTIDGIATTSTLDVDWFGTANLRVGYAAGPTLFYLKGGLAYGELNGSTTATDGSYTGTIANSDDLALGYAVGAGAEYALTDTISLKAEYQYVHLGADGSGEIYDVGGDPTGVSGSTTFNADMHVIKAGLNFRF